MTAKMNNSLDSNNIFLAGLSSLPTMLAALETQTWISIISAIILPMFFFTIGKTVDVFLQIYIKDKQDAKALKKKQEREQEEE